MAIETCGPRAAGHLRHGPRGHHPRPEGPARPSCPAPPFPSTAHQGPRAFVGASPSSRAPLSRPVPTQCCPASWPRATPRLPSALGRLSQTPPQLHEGTREQESRPSSSPAFGSAQMEQTLQKEFPHEHRGEWQATDGPSFRPPSGERCLKPSLPLAGWGAWGCEVATGWSGDHMHLSLS